MGINCNRSFELVFISNFIVFKSDFIDVTF